MFIVFGDNLYFRVIFDISLKTFLPFVTFSSNVFFGKNMFVKQDFGRLNIYFITTKDISSKSSKPAVLFSKKVVPTVLKRDAISLNSFVCSIEFMA